MYKVNGKYVRKTFPKSQIEYASLKFNRDTYEVGDTIKGTLYARSIFFKETWGRDQKTKERILVKKEENEIIKGSFRAIVEAKENRCWIK